MIAYLTCRDYSIIETAPYNTPPDAIVARCGELEEERDDGFAVFASIDGRTVADAERYSDSHEGAPPYDAATATGMYDAW